MEPKDVEFDEHDDGDLTSNTPDFRATVRRAGAIRIVQWYPWLGTSGPLHTLFAARGRARVTIADLTVLHDEEGNANEVVMDFLCEGATEHREALCRWATYAGYPHLTADQRRQRRGPRRGGVMPAQRFHRSTWAREVTERNGTTGRAIRGQNAASKQD